MSPLISTRRVEEFATAVDGRAPARRADVRELVGLVESVREVAAPPPRPDFVVHLRSELMERALVELSREPSPNAPARPDRRPALPQPRLGRRLAVAVSTVVVAGGGVGLVTTSAAALPGDMLYPVKRAAERADLLVHTDPGDDARILLGHAQTRLDEVAALLESDLGKQRRNVYVAQALVDFTDAATQGGRLLLDSYTRTGSPDDIEDLRSFTDGAASVLEQLADSLPPSSSQAYADAAAAVGALDLEAVTACPTCRDSQPVVRLATAALERNRPAIVTGPATNARSAAGNKQENASPDGHHDGQPADDDGGSDASPAPDAGLPQVPSDPSKSPGPAGESPAPPPVTGSDNDSVEAIDDLVTGAAGGGESDTGPGSTSGSGSSQPGDDPIDGLGIPDLPLPLP